MIFVDSLWLSHQYTTNCDHICIHSLAYLGVSALLQVLACVLIIVVGAVSSAFGTYSALSKIIENLK